MKINFYFLIIAFSLLCFSSKTFAATTNKINIETLKIKADQGDAYAQTSLGLIYSSGKDVTKNDQKAFEYFTKAANQNNIKAQAMLGSMYYYGKGTSKNIQKALELYTKACQKGYILACDALTQH